MNLIEPLLSFPAPWDFIPTEVVIIKILINIYIAQIPCEWSNAPVTNRWYKLNITSSLSQLVGGWPVGYLQGVEELNSWPPKTNPFSAREEDFNPGSLDYKSSALPLGHAPPNIRVKQIPLFFVGVYFTVLTSPNTQSSTLLRFVSGEAKTVK